MYPDIPAVAQGTMGAAMGKGGGGWAEDGGGGGGGEGVEMGIFTQNLQAGMTKRGRPLLK